MTPGPPPAIGIVNAEVSGAIPVFGSERSVLGIPVSRWPSIIAPVALGIAALIVWEFIVYWRAIPSYVMPGPVKIAATFPVPEIPRACSRLVGNQELLP